MLPKQNSYQGILKRALNLQISVLFTYKLLSSILQCKLKENFVFALVKLEPFL